MKRIALVTSVLSAMVFSGCVAATDPVEEGVDPELNAVSPTKIIFPTRQMHEASDKAERAVRKITNHGGPVMTNGTNVYFIWYGNWAGNTGPTILTDFASHLGGSGYWNINTTYTNSSGTKVKNVVTYKGAVNDNYSQGTALSDAAVLTVVKSAISGGGFGSTTPDVNGVYFVLTSTDVNETSGLCTQYCGWHDQAIVSGVSTKYSIVGNADRCITGCSDQSVGPNGNPGVDGMASILAHEAEEATTDPELNAWYDSAGAENGDKCAWTFGTTYSSGGALANVHLGTRDYLIQQNWKAGTTQGCAMSF